ncbi:N-acetyltransferase [bacterium]|nr:N-acetyltransferase [bacterium]
MANETIVKEVLDKKGEQHFLNLPYKIQGKNPVWVPPLRVQQKELLSTIKNPFFQHAEIRKFVAYKDGKAVGRIAAINDDAHNKTHNETTCHFGFFECIDDQATANLLMAELEKSAKQWNLNVIRGPFNPSVNEDCGLLIDAFDLPPAVMMPYNPPYYPSLIEKCGYTKAMDLYAYLVRQSDMTEKLKRGAQIVEKRTKLNFRPFNKNDFDGDAEKIWELYQKVWEDNWGAVPITRDEFDHLAASLKQIYDPDMIEFAETEDGTPIGFTLALPDVNQAFRKVRDGRLFPFGLLKIMWHTRKGALRHVRILLMGVLKEYRGKGIDAVFYYHHFETGKRKGYDSGEMSWILENNEMMNRAAVMMGGEKFKTYRIYEKTKF